MSLIPEEILLKMPKKASSFTGKPKKTSEKSWQRVEFLFFLLRILFEFSYLLSACVDKLIYLLSFGLIQAIGITKDADPFLYSKSR